MIAAPAFLLGRQLVYILPPSYCLGQGCNGCGAILKHTEESQTLWMKEQKAGEILHL